VQDTGERLGAATEPTDVSVSTTEIPPFDSGKSERVVFLEIYSGPGLGPFDAGLNEEDDLELPANLKRYDFTKVTVFGGF
jgi:hypothetical protein